MRGRCDHACVFCAVDVDAVITAQPAGEGALTLVGLEPSLAKNGELESAVQNAVASGRSPLHLQTHGANLPADRLRQLKALGLDGLEVSLHAPIAAAHDFVVGRAGSFERTTKLLENARTLGMAVRLASVLTRSTYRELASMRELLVRLGVQRWQVVYPRLAGRAATQMDSVIPRLALAVPYALHALLAAAAAGIDASISGVPTCLLGPHASLATEPTADDPRYEAEPCSRCAARPGCSGISPLYAARFGVRELRLCNAAVPKRNEFAGVGPVRAPSIQRALRRDRGQTHLRVIGTEDG